MQKVFRYFVFGTIFSILLPMVTDCTSEDIERDECIENPNVSFQNEIKPILETNCIKSGCHNGDNGADLNWSVFANVQAKAQQIKIRTTNKTMPLDLVPDGLPDEQIKLIACWVNQGAKNN